MANFISRQLENPDSLISKMLEKFPDNGDINFWTTVFRNTDDRNWYSRNIADTLEVPEVVFLTGWESATVPFTEEGSLGLTVSGASTTQNTAQKKFGAASRRMFSGSASAPHDDGLNLGSGKFTMDAWVRWFLAPTSGNQDYIITKWNPTGNNRSWAWVLDDGVFRFLWSPNGSTVETLGSGSFAPTPGTWHHLAVDYDGNDLRLYADGTMLSKDTVDLDIFASTAALTFGGRADIKGSFDELMDETRIIRGGAEYASDSGYTVPTAAFPRP